MPHHVKLLRQRISDHAERLLDASVDDTRIELMRLQVEVALTLLLQRDPQLERAQAGHD